MIQQIRSNFTVIKQISQSEIKFSCDFFATSLEDTKGQKKKKNISCVQNSLVIESTTAAGGVAVFNDGFCEFSIQFISQSTGHTFPGQDNNNDNRIGTVVPRPLLHNA